MRRFLIAKCGLECVSLRIGRKAKVPIERMLDFAKHHLPTFQGSGDA